MKWIEIQIPRQHRARIVPCCEPSCEVIDDVPRLLGQMSCRARFHQRALSADGQKADYTFELRWKRPERATPPRELLTALDSRFEIKAFELTTDNSR